MGRFDSIKKSRKKSKDIDEKIEYLNKELCKTGLDEMMTTANVYQSTDKVPNTDFSDFEALSQNGYGLGVSGADGNGAGGAYVGKVIASEHGLTPGLHDFVLSLDDVAVSPPHPQGGQRRYASTLTGIGGAFSPLRPGKIQGSGGGSKRGGALWFFDPNYNFSGQVGRWLNFEWHVGAGAWGFYDTSFITGSTYLNPNIDQYELNGVNIGQQIKDKIAGINFGDNGVIGTPQTIVLTQNKLDDPSFIPIDIGKLSPQGYNYLKDKSSVGLRAGTKRKTGRGVGAKITSGGKGGRVSSRGIGGKGGRVSSRGIKDYVKGRGVGFSPNADKVARKVANQLPPEPTPTEIRNTTVAEFRKNGDNLAANKFYTEDRIAELESKSKLSSSEQSELKQLKVQAVYQNLVTPENNVSVADQQSEHDAAAEKQSESIYSEMNSSSSEISTALDNILSSSASSGLSETERKAISSFSKAIESGEEITPELFSNFEPTPEAPTPPTPPKPTPALHNPPKEFTFPDGSKGTIATSKIDGGIGDIIKNDKGVMVEPNGLTSKENEKLVQTEKLRNNIDIATSILTNSIVEHKPSEQAIEQFKANLTPGDISKFQFNTERVGFSDGNLNVTYDANGKKIFNPNRDRSGNQGANSADLSVEFSNLNNLAIAAHGKPNAQVVLPTDGSEGYALLEKYAYHNTSTTNPFSKNFDPTELPDWQTGIVSGLVHLAANTTQGQVLQTVSDLFSKITGSDSKLPEFLNGYGIHGMAHHEIKVPLSELPANVLEEIKKNENYDAYENAYEAKLTAEKFPPPKQSSIFTDEDGIPTKYYTRSIFEGKDGKTYKSVLRLMYKGESSGGPVFGSIYSPDSYIFSVPLFDAGMDDLMGEYIPPDGLPKIPFTPPEPKNESYISESVKLGHFEPEVLNVDINDIRKGIMPEFPKDPPPEMINGYSAKSKLAPKTIEGKPFLNITKKDLAKNHRFTDKEISEYMDEINAINDYIRKNPAELKYAMIRYPKDDPRLAQLNFKMDQMKAASDEYMETHFPENKSLFNKIQQKISNTIGQTDPKNFKDHTPPPQFTDDLDIIKRRKETVSRHFKKRKRKKGLTKL